MPIPRALPFRAGPYECYHYIGGNLAEVYIARDLRTGFNRAVKVLSAGYGVDSEFMQRFVAEGRAALTCSHPNIVTTYEADQADGLAYIAMEQLQGESLKLMLERGKLRTMTERVDIALQIAEGLEHLHQKNIIHRDIKPENVNIDPSGHAKIFDLGVARQRQQQITKEGQLLGTPLYMAPEQLRSEAVTQSADIYSYGVLLFVMFTGAFPFRGVSREELFAAVTFYPPDLSPLDGKGIPPAVVELITQCLQKQPAQRPATFGAVAGRLRPLLQPSLAARQTAKAPRKLWPLLAGLAVVLVVGVSWAAAVSYLNRPKALADSVLAQGGYMVLVPAGPGLVGRDRRPVIQKAFYIDRAEVSNYAYREFAQSAGRDLPATSREFPATFPVVNVTFDDASAFCAWAGKRLPSDLEWEKAARGPAGSLYPWGDQPRVDLVNVPHGNEPHELQPVESNLNGASPYGAINMLGNVWEWVAKGEKLEESDLREFVLNPPVTREERAYQMRGGSYQQTLDLRQAVWDFAVAPARLKRSDVGFRCARGL